MSEFNSASVTALQKSHTAGWHESDPAVTQSGFAGLVESNHQPVSYTHLTLPTNREV